jgi:putative hydrolase of the HAD superfamily
MRPLIVFDLDDTLYLERDYVRSGFRAVDRWAEAELGVSDVGGAAWRLFLHGVRGRTLDEAFALLGHPLTATERSKAIKVYRCHLPSIRLCPDASEVLDSWPEAVDAAIITDGPVGSQRAKLSALHLGMSIKEAVVTAEHAGWSKPAVDAFRHVQRRFAARPSECVYIADNPIKDFIAPIALGWHTARIRRNGSLHELVPSPTDIDFDVSSLLALRELWKL